MTEASQINPETPVVCSNDCQFGFAFQMEGANPIKLKGDDKGQHQWSDNLAARGTVPAGRASLSGSASWLAAR